MKRQTIIPTFDDTARLQTIFKLAPNALVVSRDNHVILYIETEYERYVSADRWNISPKALAAFMQQNGDDCSYVSPSSFAMTLYRKKFATDDFIMPGGDYRAAFCRSALYGGRCEVYKYGKHYLYEYDINMSYPHSATKLSFPVPRAVKYVDASLRNVFLYEGASRVVFSQSGDIPILPLRYNDRVVYAVCEKQQSIYTHTELRYAIEKGVTIHSIDKQYIAEKVVNPNPFDKFVDYCYTKRIETGLKVWKVIANSLFGRLATMNSGLLHFRAANSRQSVASTPRELKDYYGVHCIARRMPVPPDSNPLWAAMVLAHARIKLHQKVDWFDTYYIDTDCMIKNRADKHLPISAQPGDYKAKEGDYEIKGAKQYLYTNPETGDQDMKLKGVSAQFRKLSDFYAAQYTQERILLPDGTTRPIEIPQAAVY